MKKEIARFALVFVLAAHLQLRSAAGGGASGGDQSANSGLPRLARTIRLPGVGVPDKAIDPGAIPGRLDHLAYDAATGRLFVAALEAGSLEVIDLNKGERVKRIEGLSKPQGIAVISAAKCLIVACGGEGAVHVYGLDDLAERAVTPMGPDADNVRCDGTSFAYVGFGAGSGAGGLAVYDASALKKVGEIPLASHAESFQLDLRPGGTRIFVNLPGQKRADNDGSIAVVDRLARQPLATWGLTGAAQNFPMAYDAAHNRVFVATRKPAELHCLDAGTGKEISRAACAADSDDLYFDAVTSRVLLIGGGRRPGETAPPGAAPAAGDAALEVFQVDESGAASKIAGVSTSPHARTGFFVPERRAIYVACPPQENGEAKILEFTLGN